MFRYIHILAFFNCWSKYGSSNGRSLVRYAVLYTPKSVAWSNPPAGGPRYSLTSFQELAEHSIVILLPPRKFEIVLSIHPRQRRGVLLTIINHQGFVTLTFGTRSSSSSFASIWSSHNNVTHDMWCIDKTG